MVSNISLLKGKTTRFAPSVTGYLHLGHLYHLLILEKLYRDAGVKVITRLEDHDTLRRRPEYERVILELLDWFGFEFYKDAPDVVRQSDRDAIYEEFLTKFPSESVFKCECTGFRLKTLKQNEWYEYHYDGKCHNDKLDDRQKYGLRVLFEDRTMVANEFHSADIRQNPFRQIHSLSLIHI